MDDRSKRIIDSGRQKGYVLCSQLDDVTEEDLDQVLTELASARVEIRQEGEVDPEPQRDLNPDDSDPVRVYLRELGNSPRLTREREIDLAKCMKAGGDEGEIAKKDLVEAHLRLVVMEAKRCARRDIHVLDLIQLGNIGLMQAVDRFDYTRGYALSPYATWWVRRAMHEATPP